MKLYFVHTPSPLLQTFIQSKMRLDGLYWCVDYPWPMWDRDVFMVKLYVMQ